MLDNFALTDLLIREQHSFRLIYSRGLISSHIIKRFFENYYSSLGRGLLYHLLQPVDSREEFN